MSIWSSWQWLTISSAASCGIRPEPALHLGQRALRCRGTSAVRFSSDQTWRIASLVKMPWKMRGVDDGGGHGGLLSMVDGWFRRRPRCRVRCACSTTGRSIMRPSSCAAPGDAASAAQHAPRPVELAWRSAPARRGSARPGVGWMHSLAPKPWRARPAPGRRSRRGSSSSCGVTPATGAGEAGDARRERDAAGGVGEADRVVGEMSQVEVEREVERAEHQARDARRAGHALDRAHAARALDQRAARARRARRRATAATLRADSALGSITPRDARVAQQARGRRRTRRRLASLMRTTMRARSASPRLRQPLRDRVARRGLGRRRDRVLEVEHDRVGAAGQRLGEALGPVAGHEQVGARQACHAQTASGGAQRRDARPRRSRARRRIASVCSPSAGTGSMRGAFVPGAGGSSAGSGPAGEPTSRQRPRAFSCGCSHTSCIVLTRALAICAASSRSTTCARGQRRERLDDDRAQRRRARPRAWRCR